MLNTYEAIYEDHKIIFLNEEPKIKKARVFITVIECNDKKETGIKSEILNKNAGVLKNFDENALDYQRRIRDEW